RVRENGARFRKQMTEAGFTLVPGAHPIIPVMLGDAQLATNMADRLLGRMRGAHLRTDARTAARHDGEREADHVDAFAEQ
ncbi:glycine C-acetyltransferase, partial [Burkholderia cenocepacia]|nr:glycine C-acetyltransferase [Burkholderia cenocepacia]